MPVRVGSSEGLGVLECRVELDGSRCATQVAWLKLQDHEGLRRCVVFRGDAEANRWLEAEAGVVARVSEHDNRANAERAAALQAGTDQGRAHALALMRRQDGHRSQPHEAQLCVPLQGNGAEHDVADDFFAVLGDQGDKWACLLAQRVNEIGFRCSLEGCQIHRPDGLLILRFFCSDDHRGSLDA